MALTPVEKKEAIHFIKGVEGIEILQSSIVNFSSLNV